MESGMPNIAAGGKRKRDGFLSEEVKDNLKVSQQWQQASVRTDTSTHEGYQYPQFQGPMVESWIQMQQQQKTDVADTASLPVLNMEQRIMAAAVLQAEQLILDVKNLLIKRVETLEYNSVF